MIPRKLKEIIESRLGKGKAVIIVGPRQVGKTTLIKSMFGTAGITVRWFNGDDADTRELFADATSTRLGALIGNATTAVIDEAQRIENIGLAVKLMVDNHPETQVIITGSSSLELANTINEPLTGRKFELNLFPLSYGEMAAYNGAVEEQRMLHHRLIYGYYPDVVTHQGEEQELLLSLCNSYLYKDMLAYQQIKKPTVLEKLVQAIALHIGNEVSLHELGQLVRLDPITVERYIDLLEKSFVLFRLPSLNRNMRNEIKNGRKIYFFDNGIRNAIVKNFNPPALRQDIGALWENFCIVERMKALHYATFFVNRYFWRTHAHQEIDYIEERNGKFHAFEFKWNPASRSKLPKIFLAAYPESKTEIITGNLETFLSPIDA